jgi:MSHA biogenesis protein MshJ
MKDRLDQLAERFEAFSLRERGWISLALLAVLFMLWDTMLMSPQELRQKQLVGEMHGINQQMQDINTQIDVMTATLRSGETQRVRARVDEVRLLLGSLQQQQQDLTVQFIRPQQMAGVLRDMLASEGKLVLTRLESLGAKPLFPPPEGEEAREPNAQQPKIFKHGMRVVFEGDYHSTLHYLQALEAMPWRLYWDNVEYQVLDYPRARVAITVHTLSLEEGWIGV